MKEIKQNYLDSRTKAERKKDSKIKSITTTSSMPKQTTKEKIIKILANVFEETDHDWKETWGDVFEDIANKILQLFQDPPKIKIENFATYKKFNPDKHIPESGVGIRRLGGIDVIYSTTKPPEIKGDRDWEKRFDEKFVNEICHHNGKCKILDKKTGLNGWLYFITPKDVKSFIRKELQSERDKAKEEILGQIEKWADKQIAIWNGTASHDTGKYYALKELRRLLSKLK